MRTPIPGPFIQRGRWGIPPALVSLLLAVTPAEASTLVAPHALFMRDDSRTTVLYVQNTGDRTQEISIELKYGYPTSDDSGDVHVELIDSPAPSEPSAAGWVRALPRRLLLAPKDRQAIRFLARPPADLPEGEYWSRVIVSSQEAEPELPKPVTGAVQARLFFETRIIVSLSYRRGEVSTGVQLNDFQAAIDGASVAADVRLERTGNAAYIGMLELALLDAEKREVGSWMRAIAVYRDLYRHIEMPVGDLPSGLYTLALRLCNERSDIPGENLLVAAPLETEMSLMVP